MDERGGLLLAWNQAEFAVMGRRMRLILTKSNIRESRSSNSSRRRRRR